MSVIDYIRNYPATSCRMHFGDTIIEELIPGYKTNYVSGRDSMMADVYEIDTEVRNFSRFRRRKRLKRELTVGFVIVSTTPEAYHKACNKLKGLLFSLDSDDQEIWFEDESDVFYKGTVTNVTCDKFVNISTGGGTITITCSDPRKYAREETEVEIQNGSFLVDYAGNYPSYPIFEADIKSTVGYLGFIDSKEHVIQIGNPESAGEEIDPSVRSIDADFSKGTSGWTKNSAYTPSSGRKQHVHTGSVNTVDAYGKVGIGSHLNSASYGSGSEWHGPSLTKTFAASKNFTCSFDIWMQYAAADRISNVVVSLDTTKSGTKSSIASIWFVKDQKGTNQGRIELCIKDAIKETIAFPVTIDNPYTGLKQGQIENYPDSSGYVYKQSNSAAGKFTITKTGSKITFNLAGTIKEFTETAIESDTATEVSIWFERWNTVDDVGGSVIYSLSFEKKDDDVSTTDNSSDQFFLNDVVTADCADGSIKVNGVDKYGLGALGNDWEEFYLVPGANEIKCNYSSWASTSPEFKMRYREVYL